MTKFLANDTLESNLLESRLVGKMIEPVFALSSFTNYSLFTTAQTPVVEEHAISPREMSCGIGEPGGDSVNCLDLRLIE